ncbi:polysaccharide deacetylase family protein [Brevibacillus migulae]|uniref:polysaccharide deacetylase family protein n=1 Tax=Brevibacillus migulae TaxID=1644114 RepID=UPI00106EDC3D|nr:polysaccharide deacetylase family protein [Brevibacillus migulae]
MKKNLGKLAVISACWGALLFAVVNSQPIDLYISKVKERMFAEKSQPVHRNEDAWRLQIEEWKREKDEQPINARIDRVWKSIVPGYNGLEVDVEASLQAMRDAEQITPQKLVYKEVPPEISKEKLGIYPIYRGNEQKPAISFMVNVAWGNEHLDRILNTLDHYHIKTTFFLDGSWVKKYPDLAKKIADRGHEIGNHAYSHPDMSKLSPERIRQEIGKTQAVIKEATGITPHLFAPPSGAFQDSVVKIAKQEFHMQTILWSADTVDWQKPSLEQMLSRVGGKLGNGVLVLMHPTQVSAQGLESLIKKAQQKGLTPTTVSEVIAETRLRTP